MILPSIRDKRFITIRRGGLLTNKDHHLLAIWAAQCAEHVLRYFEEARPDDGRPRCAIELAYEWVNGRITVKEAHAAAGHANAAARELVGAPKFAALAAGQAVAVAHVAAHELGAAAYAIRAVMAAVEEEERALAGNRECQWQRGMLPGDIRDLVIDDQGLRNDICWDVFNW